MMTHKCVIRLEDMNGCHAEPPEREGAKRTNAEDGRRIPLCEATPL